MAETKKEPVGSYTSLFKSRKKYHGKGPKKRAKKSGATIASDNSDELVDIEWTESDDDRQAFIAEFHRLDDDGGPTDDRNYNKIESPGKKYEAEDLKKKENENSEDDEDNDN